MDFKYRKWFYLEILLVVENKCDFQTKQNKWQTFMRIHRNMAKGFRFIVTTELSC